MTQVAAERAPELPSRPVHRYVVLPLSGPFHFGIWDKHLGAWCSLAVGNSLVPLEWKSAMEAQVWLYLCRVAWGRRLVPAPDGWNG